MSVELPRDAEGREIPLDTKVLYDLHGNEYEVAQYIYHARLAISRSIWDAKMLDGTIRYTTSLRLTPPDSWEKLEEDLDRCIAESDLCLYYSPSGQCRDCTICGDESIGCAATVLKDIKERIRKLRGEG